MRCKYIIYTNQLVTVYCGFVIYIQCCLRIVLCALRVLGKRFCFDWVTEYQHCLNLIFVVCKNILISSSIKMSKRNSQEGLYRGAKNDIFFFIYPQNIQFRLFLSCSCNYCYLMPLSHFCSDTGCFWGVERHCWSISGVFSIQVGYSGGFTPNSTYHEVCSDQSQPHKHSRSNTDMHIDTCPNTFSPLLHVCSLPISEVSDDTFPNRKSQTLEQLHCTQISASLQPSPKHSLHLQ